MTDLVSGVVQLGINTITVGAPLVKAGKLRGIAVSGPRNPLVPDVPTFADGGLADFEASNWYVLLAPAKTSRDVVQKLNDEVRKVQNSPEVTALLAKQGADPFPNTVAATESLVRRNVSDNIALAQEYNIKPE